MRDQEMATVVAKPPQTEHSLLPSQRGPAMSSMLLAWLTGLGCGVTMMMLTNRPGTPSDCPACPALNPNRSLQACPEPIPITQRPSYLGLLDHCLKHGEPARRKFSYHEKFPASQPELIRQRLIAIRTDRFLPSRLRPGLSFSAFKQELLAFKSKYDGDFAIEGYRSGAGQKENTVRWYWGHHIWFGEGAEKFEVSDHMADKWLDDMTAWISSYGLSEDAFSGAVILDIGTWTGSTTYMLASLGAKHIYSVEEAYKYSLFTKYVSESFQLPVTTIPRSLYDLEVPELHEIFDIVYFPGVIYHLSDPMLALRIIYNRLKPGGLLIMETMAPETDPCPIRYERITAAGNNYFSLRPSSLRELLEDAGFNDVVTAPRGYRTDALARKTKARPFKVAGLARRDVC